MSDVVVCQLARGLIAPFVRRRPDVSKPEARAVSHVNLGRQLGEDALNDEGLAGLTAAAAASLIQNSTQ